MHFRAFTPLFLCYYVRMKRRPRRNLHPSTVLLIRQVLIGVLIATFFGLLLSSVWFITRINALTITGVTVRGGETIQHSEIDRLVREQISGTYLKLVPRAFAFTYPHEAIVEKLNEVHRIKDVRVVRSGGNELVVEFGEYVPHALWCKNSEKAGCFFLDQAGYSFAPAPPLEGGAFLRFVSIGKDPKEHEQAFKEEEYKKVEELTKKFAEAKWFVSKVEIDAAGDAFFTVVDGGLFKVSLKQSADETVANLLTVLGSEKFTHIKPGNFEYIDLRFGSKVFVNEVTIMPAATSSAESAAIEDPVPSEEPVDEVAATPEEEMVEEAVATSTTE
jgi:cell division septal protein FtsQ